MHSDHNEDMVTHAPALFSRERLNHAACRERLENAEIARVVLSVRCLPSAHVVRCEVADHVIYVASDENAVLAAARRGDVVTIQTDGVDGVGGVWSVQATGMASLISRATTRIDTWALSALTAGLGHDGDIVAVPMSLRRGDVTRVTVP